MSAPSLRSRLRAWRLFRAARSYQDQGAHRKAARLYQQALGANDRDWGAWLWQGVALAEMGRFPAALERVERGLTLCPSGRAAAARLLFARVLYDSGRVEEARAQLVELLAGVENEQARTLLALCLLRLGDAGAARAILGRALAGAPWVLTRLLLAVEEQACLPAAARTDPGPEAPRGRTAWLAGWKARRALRKGLVYLRLEKWQRAWNAFSRAERLRPGNPKVAYGLGASSLYLGCFGQAQQYLEGLPERLEEPFSSDARASLGKLALETGRPREAVLPLRRAIAAGADTPENRYALGLAWLRAGRPALARRAFEKCVTAEFVRQRLEETRPAARPA